MEQKRLSILICSILERAKLLHRLLVCLKPQVTDEVEIITEIDNCEMSIGEKRNKLLLRASGDYVAFIDDDDLVSGDYISKILTATKTSPDCCSLQGEISHVITIHTKKTSQQRTRIIKRRQRVNHVFFHSIEYDHWFEDCGVYYRCPNHLNAIKRDIALQVGFPSKNSGEDHDFSTQVFPLLKTEAKIEGTIYYYLAS